MFISLHVDYRTRCEEKSNKPPKGEAECFHGFRVTNTSLNGQKKTLIIILKIACT